MFRAFAAAHLGMPQLLRSQVDEPSIKARARTYDWLTRRLDDLERRPLPLVVLLNPAEVMSAWNPIPGFSMRVIEVDDIDSIVKELKGAHVVFHEAPAVRHLVGLHRNQYVLISAKGRDRYRLPSREGPLMLLAPSSLRAALQLHQRVVTR